MKAQSIGKEMAIKIYESQWWKNFTPRQIAVFQLFTEELCCDWGVFHASVEASLGRSVWSHQFGSKGVELLRNALRASESEYNAVKSAIAK